jgi:hypothetical protein
MLNVILPVSGVPVVESVAVTVTVYVPATELAPTLTAPVVVLSVMSLAAPPLG